MIWISSPVEDSIARAFLWWSGVGVRNLDCMDGRDDIDRAVGLCVRYVYD